MPLYYAAGDQLVPILETSTILDLAETTPKPSYSPSLTSRLIEDLAAKTALTPAEDSPIPFEDIGMGKPLVIWIDSVYSGNLPPRRLWGKVGAVVTSAIKSWDTFDKKPRAINYIKQDAQRNSVIASPTAIENGMPIVYYSPAVLEDSLLLTIEVAFNTVNQALFDTVNQLASSTASIPIFAPYANMLLTIGGAFKIGGNLGNSLFDNSAEFQSTEPIYLEVSGKIPTKAGYYLMTEPERDKRSLAEYKINQTGQLVHKTSGEVYSGDTAYIIIALTGKESPKLEKFTATLASAALLQEFFGIRENNDTNVDVLLQAMQLYNDTRYAADAKKVQEQIKNTTDATEKAELNAKLEALLKNISSSDIKNQLTPPAVPTQ
jgi:hypothetical protein